MNIIILKYPVNYIAITQYYKKGVHNGLDLGWSNNYGGNEVEIYAPEDGIVVSVQKNYTQTDASGSSYGNFVKIKHGNEVSTLCAHLKYGSVTLNVGDTVKKGDVIGRMGRTGRADGNHVHYEVFINEEKVNPENYTYVYPDQIISNNPSAVIGLLFYMEPTPPAPELDPEPICPDISEYEKRIHELEDKILLQQKEIELLKNELSTKEDFIFEYNVLENALYQIKLYEGEKLYIK